MLILLWLLIICTVRYAEPHEILAYHKKYENLLSPVDLESVKMIREITSDIIKDTNVLIASMYKIRVDNLRSAPYEVGYVMYTIQEKYRKMVDKYNTSHFMNRTLFIMEHVFYLEEIEHHYWEIEHLANMAHEIERKYKIRTSIHEDYRLEKALPKRIITTPVNPYHTKAKRKRKFKWENRLSSTPKKRFTGRFPWDYGWEVEGLPDK